MIPPYRWNPRLARYQDGRGRIVPRADIQGALNYALGNAERRILALGERFRAGELSLQAWRDQTMQLVKETHLYSAAAARGGWDRMTPADYGRVGARLRFQYDRLNRFADQIADETQRLDGRFVNRVRMYAKAARRAYVDADHAVQRELGMTERRNLLNPGDSCETCVAMRDLGWVSLEDDRYVEIGDRECLTNCNCEEEYR